MRTRSVLHRAVALAILSSMTGGSAIASTHLSVAGDSVAYLANDVQQTHPAPLPEGDAYYTNDVCCAGTWTTVAVRGEKSDNDLKMYADAGHTILLASSRLRGKTIDFISDFMDDEEHYPVVTRKSGTGDYTVEWADSGTLDSGRSIVLQTTKTDLVWSYTVSLAAGATTTFTADPGGRNQDVSIFVMQNTGTEVRPRILAVDEESGAGPGETETLSFTAPVAGTYGIVFLQEAGKGILTLGRDLP